MGEQWSLYRWNISIDVKGNRSRLLYNRSFRKKTIFWGNRWDGKQKVKSALKHNIKPIVCVGETLEERESAKEEEVVKEQVLKALEGIDKEYIKDIVIAYEPIWAIGTGKTASSDDANQMCGFIREIIGNKYDKEAKDNIRIQYGGSVKPNTIKELMAKEEIDGALVGGASLVAEDFVALVNY